MSAPETQSPEGHTPDDTPDWMRKLADSKWGLGLLSFMESTVVPIPLEAILVPLMVSQPRKAIGMGAVVWIGCIVGAVCLYFAGMLLLDPVVEPFLSWLGMSGDLQSMQSRLEGENLFFVVFLISLAPAPMQIAALGAGAVGGNFLVFLLAIVLSRGLRYFGLAYLAREMGWRLVNRGMPRKRLAAATLAVIVLVFVVLHFVGN